MSAGTGEYLARGFLGRGDAYTLRLLPARVVVLMPIVSRGGAVKVASSRVTRLRSGQRRRVEAAQCPPKVVRYSVAGSLVTNARRARLSGAAFDALLGTAVFKAAKSASCTVEQYVDAKSLDARALHRRVGGAALTEPTVRISANVSIDRRGAMTGTLAARDIASGAEITSVPAVGQVSDLFGATDAPLPQLLNVLFGQLCVPDLPTTITGTFSSSTVLPWGAHYEDAGTATFVRATRQCSRRPRTSCPRPR